MEKLKAFFLKVFKPKPQTSSLADHIRTVSFHKEKLRLANLGGRKEAREQSKQSKKQPKKTNFLDNLGSFSKSIEDTFKPTMGLNQPKKKKQKDIDLISQTFKPSMEFQTIIPTKNKKQKNNGDGISPTFKI